MAVFHWGTSHHRHFTEAATRDKADVLFCSKSYGLPSLYCRHCLMHISHHNHWGRHVLIHSGQYRGLFCLILSITSAECWPIFVTKSGATLLTWKVSIMASFMSMENPMAPLSDSPSFPTVDWTCSRAELIPCCSVHIWKK